MVELFLAPLNVGPPRLNTDLSHQMVILVWAMFIGAIFVLAKFVWKPILEALTRREIHIRSTLAKASGARRAVEEAVQRQKQVEIDAAVRARAIEAQAVATARTFWAKLAEDAEAEADRLRREAEQQIELERVRVLEGAKRQSIELAAEMAGKILQREIAADGGQGFTNRMIESVS